MSMLEQLEEMGFDRELAEKALHATSDAGLVEAVEWIAANQKEDNNRELPKDSTEAVKTASGSETVDEQTEADSSNVMKSQAASYVCDVCGKQLADDQAVMFHAARTKHEAFSESADAVKPMTEEEKKIKLAALQAKLKEARVRREEAEKREAVEKEKRRRREGQSLAKIQEERNELEMKRLVDIKKRERKEEAEARKRVLEQIRLDREARKAALNPVPAVSSHVIQQPISSKPLSDDTSCHIQVRLPNGSVIKEKFKSDEPLSHVRLWVEIQGKEVLQGMPFTLMTPFPRKIFTNEDMETPVKALGLTPSASMVVTRPSY